MPVAALRVFYDFIDTIGVFALEYELVVVIDKKLKDKATLENVKVSGILFLTDMLTKESVIDGGEMITALERLLSSNSRLPKKLIKERIETLKRQTAL